jgi:hypothetical protein
MHIGNWVVIDGHTSHLFGASMNHRSLTTHPCGHNSRQHVRVAAGLAAIGTGSIVMRFQRLEILADADGAIVQPKLTAVCDYLSTPEGL